ncbi:host attachment protein [Crenothrix polyspora]|uniref:Host attachment protein n=1 Tax=Crenothrix polyspora TaxID=360316 RepID=A0A1R4H5Z8_9GAMM|nr:host attachment protein [Crenothrix polyspora]SJM91698.1 Host attachment protein [Crenothrix polyspora]
MKLTWILVADNTRARFFTAATPSSALEEFDGLAHPEGRLHDREITTDLPGRIKSSDGVGHAFSQQTDPKQHESDVFAKLIKDCLVEAYNAHKFEQIILVAGPSFLGLLRSQLPDQLEKSVCYTVDKSITTLSVTDIRQHLPEFLPHH